MTSSPKLKIHDSPKVLRGRTSSPKFGRSQQPISPRTPRAQSSPRSSRSLLPKSTNDSFASKDSTSRSMYGIQSGKSNEDVRGLTGGNDRAMSRSYNQNSSGSRSLNYSHINSRYSSEYEML